MELWDEIRKNDKHSITCTDLHKPSYCIVETLLVLGQATGKFRLTRLTRPGLGEATTFPLIV